MSSPIPDAHRIGNRYRLDERIGAGAMGAVWRGTDELLNRTVAVKELLAAALPSDEQLEESRQRILREGRIGARLQHAHVISMFDVVVHDDRPWLVMEYLPSRSLAAVLAEKGPIPPREAAAIGDAEERMAFLNAHPDRQDVRMVVGVLRNGEAWCAIRSRTQDSSDRVVTGDVLVPGLVEALNATLD